MARRTAAQALPRPWQLRAFDAARRLASKNKRRFQEDGFDLDLSYVTNRIVAMGFPSTGWEAVYRNPREQVQQFFEQRHKGHFKVYNLCSERRYDLQGIFPEVEYFPFDDHNPCPFEMLVLLLDNITEYLERNERNVVAVHCKAGKGRTGLVVSALLLHLGLSGSALEAMHMFGERRTHNGQGVTIPSQIRYVQYYARLLRARNWEGGGFAPRVDDLKLPKAIFKLNGIRMMTLPQIGTSRVTPYFKVYQARFDPVLGTWQTHCVFCLRRAAAAAGRELKAFDFDARSIDLNCSNFNVLFAGDILIKIYASSKMQVGKRLCQVWFNTSFVRGGRRLLQFGKERVDVAHKDHKCRYFNRDFALQMRLLSNSGGDSSESDSEESSHPAGEWCTGLFPMCNAHECNSNSVTELEDLSIEDDPDESELGRFCGEDDLERYARKSKKRLQDQGENLLRSRARLGTCDFAAYANLADSPLNTGGEMLWRGQRRNVRHSTEPAPCILRSQDPHGEGDDVPRAATSVSSDSSVEEDDFDNDDD